MASITYAPDILKMTAREWRNINPDWKAVEAGRRYVLWQEVDGTRLVAVEIVESGNPRKAKPDQPWSSAGKPTPHKSAGVETMLADQAPKIAPQR